jgi:subtilisin family serine protease
MTGIPIRRRPLTAPLALCIAVLAMLPFGAPAGASNDTFFEDQWSLAQIHAPDAWGTATGAGVTIGIVDTGVDSSHPDLRSKIDATADCVGGTCREGGGDDLHGHGTLVAGIAAAATGNGRGMAGVAPDARLVVARAVDSSGRGAVEDINAAVRWVVDQGAKVVNLSLGDPNFLVVSVLGTPLRFSIEYAWSRGAVPVLASGNENLGVLDLGSSNYGTLNALVVGATTKSGFPATYSSPIGNAKWGLTAPGGSGAGAGEDILSTFPDGRYAWVAGTSMAVPHASGALALLLSSGYSASGAVQRLLSTADTSVRCGPGCQGRLDVAAAVGGSGGGSPSATPPSSAAASGPRAAAVTTTTPPPPSASSPTTAGPPPELAAPGLPPEGLFSRTFEYSDDPGRRGPLVALAAALALAAGAGVAGVSWARFRAGERW